MHATVDILTCSSYSTHSTIPTRGGFMAVLAVLTRLVLGASTVALSIYLFSLATRLSSTIGIIIGRGVEVPVGQSEVATVCMLLTLLASGAFGGGFYFAGREIYHLVSGS